MKRDLVTELAELTYRMADTDPDTDAFGVMLGRRGEMMEELCSGVFDPNDNRIALIERDGAELQSIVESRCTRLRDEMTVLSRAAIMVDGVRSTLVTPQFGVDVTA